MATAPVAVGETIAGRYHVERSIGAGGMGVVVAARHLVLEKTVAIKFLLPEHTRDAELVARFRREAQALGGIDCENVARVMDVAQLEDGTWYMVMEYLDGVDVASAIRSRGEIGVAEAVGWVCEACVGVAEAHAAGIVHRDLKPANLFLARRPNGRTVVKVLDFGISKSIRNADGGALALTSTQAMLGSPLYMAPEQLQKSRDVDPRTDIWALGVILYELLACRRPFDADSLGALVSAILHEEPASVHAVRPAVPEALSAVVARCLEKDRVARFQSAEELLAALTPFAAPRVATAPPPATGAASALASTFAATPATDPPPVPVASAPPERTGRDSAWGGTKPNLENAARRRTLYGAIALGVVAVVALVVAFTMRSQTGPDEARPAPASSAPAPAVSSTPPVVVAEPKPSAEIASANVPAKPPPSPVVAVPRPVVQPTASAAPSASETKAPPKPAPSDPAAPPRPTLK